ncbi:hypothetical protein NQ314_018880 [Rhamnusium bicolor]|uniref:Platelet-derived growth factor (PDGF) family profile domain-containing protein n=1 Tax=Rhamnusium bicolor TaxID=1586634 RepID=A0AAV8WPN5_9CUCU|nr:hypothetical protein NQ314_018880 [Rhamnusium bicolor]
MVKLLLVIVISLFFINGILTCQWVCIDKKNNIKKHYFNKRKLKVEYSMPIIEVPAPERSVWKPNFSIPEVTLRMPAFEVEPLQVNCKSKQFTKTVKEITKKTKCEPRETIVDIVYDGAKVVPNKVSTKLCTGVCSGAKTCVSVESRNISLAVRTILSNEQIQCSTVMVPEDIKCKCDCDIKQSDCLPTQIFEKKFCKCKCVNEDEYLNCLNKIKHSPTKKYTWNKETCACQCVHEKICTTGTVWNRNECKCVRILT